MKKGDGKHQSKINWIDKKLFVYLSMCLAVLISPHTLKGGRHNNGSTADQVSDLCAAARQVREVKWRLLETNR